MAGRKPYLPKGGCGLNNFFEASLSAAVSLLPMWSQASPGEQPQPSAEKDIHTEQARPEEAAGCALKDPQPSLLW